MLHEPGPGVEKLQTGFAMYCPGIKSRHMLEPVHCCEVRYECTSRLLLGMANRALVCYPRLVWGRRVTWGTGSTQLVKKGCVQKA